MGVFVLFFFPYSVLIIVLWGHAVAITVLYSSAVILNVFYSHMLKCFHGDAVLFNLLRFCNFSSYS